MPCHHIRKEDIHENSLFILWSGAQHPGMGKDLYDNYAIVRAIFDSCTLDFDVKQLCFERAPKETLVIHNMPSLQSSCTAWLCTLLRSFGVEADVCAGLSLGEYSALCYANAFSIEDGTKIVAQRGKIMANALPQESAVWRLF